MSSTDNTQRRGKTLKDLKHIKAYEERRQAEKNTELFAADLDKWVIGIRYYGMI